MSARYAIGIDLGTTNCALASALLDKDQNGAKQEQTQILEIGQWHSQSLLRAEPTLPSFLYSPPPAGDSRQGDHQKWIAGRWAREQSVKTPGRVVQSAKSWLCAHGSDRSSKFLPWGSEEIPSEEKLSPVSATALLLSHLRDSWQEAMGAEAPFDEQRVTVTVPASFDAVAQKLTLDAAEEAGYPVAGGGVSLLEEPQAAFYRWLEGHVASDALEKKLHGLADGSQYVLIVDIGGGTSDFSLFEVELKKGRREPDIKRVAVSDHILLGGDNMDLALAHQLETRLGSDEKLSADQWSHLVARCRGVKEEALANAVGASATDADGETATFKVSIPGRGSGLMAGTLNTEIAAHEVVEFLLDGFYPHCDSEDEPRRADAALREWGLSYAADSGITRYLADFLRGLPKVDAVLFNGGSLQAAAVRTRLVEMLHRWQGGNAIVVLDNEEKDLAVARGAARYGWLSVRDDRHRIQAGAAHALYLESRSAQGETDQLVCILPKGTPREEEVRLEGEALGLQVRVNQPVSFRLFSSTRGGRHQPGDVITFQDGRYHAMPALQTIITSEDRDLRQVPVTLSSRLNALGLLQVDCLGDDKRWPLEFQLREAPAGDADEPADTAAAAPIRPGVESDLLEQAKRHLVERFQSSPGGRNPLTPTRLTKDLEGVLGLPKRDWNAALLRELWPALHQCFSEREHSFDHEESWAGLAGLLLRPGFGVALDEQRIDQLWEFHIDGFRYQGKAMQVNADVLWRRVAGGLSASRQASLADDAEPRVRQSGKKIPVEAVRLLGALERLPPERKSDIAQWLIERAASRLSEGGYADPFLAALSRLLNRALFRAGPESVVAPELVAQAFEQLGSFDWAENTSGEMNTLFMRAARMIDDRRLDLDSGLRKRIVSKLKKSGVAPIRLVPLHEVVPLLDTDRASLFGESLPGGLVLAGGE